MVSATSSAVSGASTGRWVTGGSRGASGVAVYQDRTWKVGLASFCSLMALENGGKTSSLPSACKMSS
jgi:hypothetical protein